ncbi:Uncharacterised protein [Mycobacterium tuberculosis]|nr:Uncharacterised protein [Mycobacterium tuberculosis]
MRLMCVSIGFTLAGSLMSKATPGMKSRSK